MSTTIRQHAAPRPAAFALPDVAAQAEQIISEARRQAQRILAETRSTAQREFEQQRQRGMAKGLAEGRQAGLRQALQQARDQALRSAEAELAHLARALQAALEDYDQRKRAILAEAEQDMIGLALAIAQRVCKRLPQADPLVAQENLRHTLALARHQSDLVVRVNPDELRLLSAALPALQQEIGALPHVRLEADSTVERGGCSLRSRQGEIDAAVRTQLDRIAAVLLGDEQP